MRLIQQMKAICEMDSTDEGQRHFLIFCTTDGYNQLDILHLTNLSSSFLLPISFIKKCLRAASILLCIPMTRTKNVPLVIIKEAQTFLNKLLGRLQNLSMIQREPIQKTRINPNILLAWNEKVKNDFLLPSFVLCSTINPEKYCLIKQYFLNCEPLPSAALFILMSL
jgi:hypothetical protein